MPVFPSILSRFLVLSCTLLLAASAVPTRAQDRIELLNGDRISGEILKKTPTRLVIRTTYGGEVSIAWNSIKSLQLDKKMHISTTDRKNYFAPVTISPDGRMRIHLENGEIIESNVGSLQTMALTPPQRQKKLKSSGYIKLSANASRGNSDTERLNLDTEWILRSDATRWTLGAVANRAKEDDTTTLSKNKATVKYDRYLSKKQYWQANLEYFDDEIAGLEPRISAGLGTGYDIWSSKKRNMSVEGGLNQVVEKYKNKEDRDYAAFRWSLRFDHLVFNTKAKFFHKQTALIDIKETDKHSLSSQTGISIPFAKKFETSTQVNLDYNNSPGIGKQKTDLIYMFSIGYKW